MSALVSVIIPNFNEEKFIGECIDSILNQTYKNIEILVIDDGSSDSSVAVVTELMKEHGNIRIFYQHRQNAAIARNVGINNAKGDYLLFLDSDDYVYPQSVERLVEAATLQNADFVIGNMKEMDENSKVTKELRFFSQDGLVEDYKDLIDLVPAPTNKFYKASVIKENGLCFGNVRIGQDLNFYLKYLVCCKRIYSISDYVYAWRDVATSMSRGANYRIFDIVESFKDIRLFYQELGHMDDYNNYIRMIEYHNYYRQMDKQSNFDKRKVRKLIVDYFKQNIEALGRIEECHNYAKFEDSVKKCRMKLRFKTMYISEVYRRYMKNK